MLHRAALVTASGYVAKVRTEDLDRATPCGGWTLADLLAHMIGQHHGFADAVRHGDAGRGAYAPVPFSRSAWDGSVESLLDAFAAADPHGLSREIELAPNPLPNAMLVGAQLLDTVVHTWDVARSLTEDHTPPYYIVLEVFAIARGVPDAAKGDGKVFATALPDGGTTWARVLRLVGRDPGWA